MFKFLLDQPWVGSRSVIENMDGVDRNTFAPNKCAAIRKDEIGNSILVTPHVNVA